MSRIKTGTDCILVLSVIFVALLTIIDTSRSETIRRDRRGISSRIRSTPEGLRPVKMNVVRDGFEPRPEKQPARAKRSASDVISLQEPRDNLELGTQETVDIFPDERPNPEIKRRWTSGRNMAVWGKRDDQEGTVADLIEGEKRKWGSDRKMAVWGKRTDDDIEEIKRKWRNDQRMAVWGRRSAADDYPKKRKWQNGNRMELWGKRKWLSRNMAVWGKRDANDVGINDRPDSISEIDKRGWRGRDMAVWG